MGHRSEVPPWRPCEPVDELGEAGLTYWSIFSLTGMGLGRHALSKRSVISSDSQALSPVSLPKPWPEYTQTG